MRFPGLLLGFLALLVVSLMPAAAQAYPQWQFSSGTTRCSQCHYSPAGGGLLTNYGRDAIGEDLSTWEGDGSFLHGATELPDWLKLGLDWRMAFLANDDGGPDQPKSALFPMQLDAQLRLEFDAFSFNAIGGFRAQARKTSGQIPENNFQPGNENRLVSREHFVSWQPSTRGAYVRAGRFFAPFGLRMAEHMVYVRRDLGFNNLQESYNLSGGYLENEWEAHVTVFAPDYVQNTGTQEMGAAAYYERRLLDETAGVAAQVKYAKGNGGGRAIAGLVGKIFIEPAHLLILGEGNIVHQMPDGTDAAQQFAGLFGASFLPVRGIMLTAFGERYASDLLNSNAAVNAGTGLLSWFPYPHFEVQLVGRMQAAATGDPIKTFLAQFHYFL
jgi:hypothetical protein